MVDSIKTLNPSYLKTAGTAGSPANTGAVEADAAQTEAAAQEPQVDTYEPSQKETTEEVTYKPNSKLVEQLKAEQAQIQARFIETVRKTLGQQGAKIGESSDDFWKFIASGDYTVDEETKAAAQQAISEDGYWGVKQTSERLVNFAKALVGGDPSRVEEMREAFQKGFDAAAKVWGGDLPSIAQDTRNAAMKLFDEWAKEGASETEVQEAEAE